MLNAIRNAIDAIMHGQLYSVNQAIDRISPLRLGLEELTDDKGNPLPFLKESNPISQEFDQQFRGLNLVRVNGELCLEGIFYSEKRTPTAVIRTEYEPSIVEYVQESQRIDILTKLKPTDRRHE